MITSFKTSLLAMGPCIRSRLQPGINNLILQLLQQLFKTPRKLQAHQ